MELSRRKSGKPQWDLLAKSRAGKESRRSGMKEFEFYPTGLKY